MNYRRILGRIDREEFVGRDRELEQIVRHPSRNNDGRGLLVLSAPPAGVSELLRQAFDQLFAHRSDAVPIYFSLTRRDANPSDAALRFFTTFLQQYVAYRRIDPALCEAPLSLNDLVELSLPTDYEWIARLMESFERERAAHDERAFVQLCFGAPQKANAAGRLVFPMIDGLHFAVDSKGAGDFSSQVAGMIARSQGPYAIGGPRRQVLDVVRDADEAIAPGATVKLEKLSDNDARLLVERIARRYEVEINDQTRDLI